MNCGASAGRERKNVKLLLVEDDQETAGHVVDALEGHGHAVEHVDNGSQGLVRALAGEYAALIVDRMLPGVDGLSLVQALREEGLQTPVLMLTTMGGLDDRVEGLEGGADDYLVKPFALRELQARLRALLRRTGDGEGESESLLEVHDDFPSIEEIRPSSTRTTRSAKRSRRGS